MESVPFSSIQERCKVCGLPANGMHFGAFTCRACAAFFRRAANRKFQWKCESNLEKCKNCRLQRCYEAGMRSDNFQFGRDLIGSRAVSPTSSLPKTIEQAIGRPYFVLHCNPEVLFVKRNIIDCLPLMKKAEKLIEFGSVSPVFSKNRLLKLAHGFQQIQNSESNQVKIIRKIGQNEIMSFLEADFLRVTKWFTCLDEFHFLDKNQQLTLLQGVWHMWARLHKLAVSAIGRRRGICDNNKVMVSHQNDFAMGDLNEIEMDMSWCTNYSNEQIRYFLDSSHDSYIYQVIDEMLELNPNDVELSYMLCQLCLQYAGQRFQGVTLEFCEKTLGLLADDLHSYYLNQLKMPKYAGRLAKLMKVNNKIRESVLKTRERQQIAKLFNVWTVDFSHPENFKDV